MLADLSATHQLASAIGNCILLEQAIAALERLTKEQYGSAQAHHASVGAQFRHILDHYASLFDGIDVGRVNYDARGRNRTLEEEPEAAAAAARHWIAALRALDVTDGDRGLLVHSDSGGGPQMLDWRQSSIGRELQFLASHSLHHFAVIKLLLERIDVSLDEDFGMAPSTRAHRAATR